MHITVQRFHIGKYVPRFHALGDNDLTDLINGYLDGEEQYVDYINVEEDRHNLKIIDIHATALFWDKKKEKWVLMPMHSFLTWCSIEKMSFCLNKTYDVKLY